MQTLRICVLVLAVGAALKGMCGLIWPTSAQKLVDWWLAIPTVAARVGGVALGLCGLLLIGLVVWHVGQPVLAAAMLIGVLCIGWGFAYQYPAVWRTAMKPFSSQTPVWRIRALAIVALLIAALLLTAALWNWSK